MKQGFSLVELSVVLVILGLLTGGILGGQNMIHSAKLRSIHSDVSSFKIAVAAFEESYMDKPGDLELAKRYWPDDSQFSGFATENGDGNGMIAGTGPTGDESAFAWQHLSLSGLVPGNFNGDTFAEPGISVPASKFGSAGYFIAHTFQDPIVIPIHSYTGHFITIGEVYMASIGSSVLSGPDAYSLDAKFDDGQPHTGSILAQQGAPDFAGCMNAAFDEYLLSEEDETCVLNFTID